MMKIYFRSVRGAQMEEIPAFRSGAWIHVEDPTRNELNDLAEAHGLETGHLEDALDPFEVPRYEVEGSTVYLFTRYPVQDREATRTASCLMIFTESGLITVSGKALPGAQAVIKSPDAYTTQKGKLLLQLLAKMNQAYNAELQTIARNVLSLRRQLQLEDIRNKDIAKFVVLGDVLQDFLYALVPTQLVFSKLLSAKRIKFFEEDKDLIEDLQLNTNQLIELSRNNAKSIVTIRESYSTIMTNNLNRVIKLLTSLTILLMIPNLVFSFYGMNVGLPGDETLNAYKIILGAVSAVTLLLAAIFVRWKWL